ncbi:hypothetical protein SAMN05720472_1781 [Fibrobacter sp. UWR3]|jgi:hypothetical protein|uniref:hypothetical protein n=1 Tax=Fibrobacter sp. UWR3 TaxID=1896217 RepID=UPI00091B8AE1|nr:hypothetical protein [Fibrobacter sp. UWR3]SHM64096.1 hypothetical protein SAMN05720472_1781 [Fibrobacter sp. UWR3]
MNKKELKGLMGVFACACLLAACASNPPAKEDNSDEIRARADAAQREISRETGEVVADDAPAAAASSGTAASAAEDDGIIVSTVNFKTRPTVLVAPAMGAKMAGSIDVIRRNPLAKTAMEVINAYLTSRDYTVIGLESQSQLDEVVQLQSDIAGNSEDLAYVAGLSVGADINITYAGSIQEDYIVIDLNASEASTANLLASESIRLKDNGESQRVLVQKAIQLAIKKLENKVRGRLAEEQEKGALYKVVAHLTGDFTDDQAEEISNMVSIKMRKKFNKMQVISMSRNTYDLLIYVDPNKYEDAQMVYGEFVESLEGLAKVRKQNITKKLIILEIQ